MKSISSKAVFGLSGLVLVSFLWACQPAIKTTKTKPTPAVGNAVLKSQRATLSDDLLKYLAADKLQKARIVVENIIAIDRKLVGKTYPKDLDTLIKLAQKQVSQAHYQNARNIWQLVADVQENRYGQDDWRSIDAKQFAGHIDRLSKLTPAEHERLKETRKLQMAAYRQATARNYDQAMQTREQTVANLEALLGRGDRQFADELAHLAAMVRNKKDYVRAAALYSEVLVAYETVLGLWHPQLDVPLNNLGYLASLKKEYARAGTYYRRAVDILQKTHGPKHRGYKSRLKSLATVYGKIVRLNETAGNQEMILKAWQGLLATKMDLLGKSHWQVTDTRWGLKDFEARRWLSANARAELAHTESLQVEATALVKDKKYRAAIQTRKKIIDIYQKYLGLKHPTIARQHNLIGNHYTWLNDTQNYELFFKKAYKLRLELLGPDHPRLADSLANMGYIHRIKKEYDEAANYYRRAADLRKRLFGQKNKAYLSSLDWLVRMLKKAAVEKETRQQYTSAVQIRREIFDIERRRQKTDPWQVTDARLAFDYAKRIDRLDEAGRKQLFSAIAMEKKATALYDEKNYAEAAVLREKALKIRKQLLGDTHAEYADHLNRLSVLYSRLKEYPRSALLAQKALELYQKTAGENHPETARMLANLGYLYKQMEDHGRAVDTYRKAVALYRQIEGQKSKKYLTQSDNLISVLKALAMQDRQRGKWEKALKAREEVSKITATRFGDNHWRAVEARWQTAYYKQLAGLNKTMHKQLSQAEKKYTKAKGFQKEAKWQEALNEATKGLERISQVLGATSRNAANVMALMGDIHFDLKAYEAAARTHRQAMQIRQKILGDSHPDVALSMNQLALSFENRGLYAQAEDLFRVSGKRYESAHGLKDSNTKIVLNNLARVLKIRGEQDEKKQDFVSAKNHLQEVLQIKTNLYGPDSWQVKEAGLALKKSQHRSTFDADRFEQLQKADGLYRQARELIKEEKFGPALSAANKAATVHREIWGTEDPQVAEDLILVGDLLDLTSTPEAAKAPYEKALGIRRHKLGNTHPDTLLALERLGYLLTSIQKYKSARPLLEEALSVREKRDGSAHSETKRARKKLNNLLAAIKDPQSSGRMFSVMQHRRFGRAGRFFDKGVTHKRKGRIYRAIAAFKKDLAISRQIFGDDAAMVATTHEILAQLYMQKNKFAAAREARQEALRIKTGKYGVNHWKVVDARLALAETDKFIALNTSYRKRLDATEQMVKQVAKLSREQKNAEALVLLQKIAIDYREVLSEGDRKFVDSLFWIGTAMKRMGKIEGAISQYEDALARQRKILGPQHPQISDTLLELGLLEKSLERHNAARQYFNEALKIRKSALGPEDVKTADLMIEQGALYFYTQDYSSAFAYFKQAWAIYLARHGEDHKDTANSLNGMAVSLQGLKDYPAAKTHFEKALKIWKKVLGPKHPTVAYGLSNLGDLHDLMGDPVTARTMLEEALEIRKNAYGLEHLATAKSLKLLGILDASQQQYDQAEAHYRQALAIEKKLRGIKHPRYIKSAQDFMALLAHSAQKQADAGDFSAARKIHHEIIAFLTELFGPSHYKTRRARIDLNHLNRIAALDKKQRWEIKQAGEWVAESGKLREQFKYPLSILLLEKALPVYENYLGLADYETLSTQALLALCHTLNKSLEKARALYVSASMGMEALLGADHPEYATFLSFYGRNYQGAGEYLKAENIYQRLMKIQHKALGQDHPEYKLSLEQMADLYRLMAGKYEKDRNVAAARQAHKKRIRLMEARWGLDHRKVTDSHRELARLELLASMPKDIGKNLAEAEKSMQAARDFYQKKDFVQALEAVRAALGVYQKNYGNEHQDTIACLRLSGSIKMDSGDYAAARKDYLSELAATQKVYGETHPETSAMLNRLGILLRRMGAYTQARKHLEQALSLNKRLLGAKHTTSAISMVNLGMVLNAIDHDVLARQYFETALAIFETDLGPKHSRTIWAREHLGVLQQDMGNYVAARSNLERVLKLRIEVQGPDNDDTAWAMINLGSLHQIRQDYAQAFEMYQSAMAIYEKLHGRQHVDVAHLLRTIGNLHVDMEDYETGRRYLNEALKIYRAAKGDYSNKIALILNNMGRLHRLRNDYDTARDFFEQSLALLRKAHGPSHPLVLSALESLGHLFEVSGNYEKAQNYYEEALFISEKKWGLNHLQVAKRLDVVSRAMEAMGQYDLARKYLQRALEIYQKSFGQKHAAVARTLRSIGYLNYFLGDYAAARRYQEQGLAVDRDVWGNTHRQTALSLNYLGVVVQAMGDYEAARTYWEEGLAITREVVGNETLAAATDLNNLAVLLKTSEPLSAKKYSREALGIYLKMLAREKPPGAQVLLRVARQYKRMDQEKKALPYYEKALSLRQKQFGDDHPETAQVLNELGNLLRAMDDWAGARPYYDQVLTIYKKAYGNDSVRAATAHLLFGKALYKTGDAAAGHRHLDQSVTIYKKIRGLEHPGTANRLANVAGFLFNQKEHLVARALMTEALNIRVKVLGQIHPDTIDTRLNLGHMYAVSDKIETAWQYMATGSKQIAELIGRRLAANPEGGHLAMVKYRRYVLESLLSLAETDLNYSARQSAALLENILAWKGVSGQSVKARQEAVVLNRDATASGIYGRLKDLRRNLVQMRLAGLQGQSAKQYQKKLANLINEQDVIERKLAQQVKGYSSWRQSLQAGPEAIGAHLDDGSVLIELVKYRQFDFHAESDGWGKQRYAALVFKRPAKTIWHTDFTLAKNASRDNGVPLMIYFHAKWAAPSVKMEREMLGSAEVLETLKAGFVTLKIDIDKHKDLATRFGIKAIPSIVFMGADDTVKQKIQGAKDRKALLVELKRFSTDARMPAETPFVVLGEAAPIEASISAWRQTVAKGRPNPKIDTQIRQQIWEPLFKSLPPNTKKLFVAPDGQLALLPFEAIRLADGRYLVEEFQVSYLANGRDLVPRALKVAGAIGPAVIVSNPDYDDARLKNDSIAPQAKTKQIPQGQNRELNTWLAPFETLPGFAHETDAVAKVWRKARPNQALTILDGAAASEKNIENIVRPRLLYLITHGFFLPDLKSIYANVQNDDKKEMSETKQIAQNSARGITVAAQSVSTQRFRGLEQDPLLRSGLALSGVNRWRQRAVSGQNDGLLMAAEVQNLDLWGTELVVLSACETGLGKVEVGEGVMGLRRSFQQAGADTILASLWPVPDAETVDLMSRFFKTWLSGKTKPEALRSAQLALIAKLRKDPDKLRRLAPPKLWAGFVIHGRPN